jgi:hypothetical protein
MNIYDRYSYSAHWLAPLEETSPSYPSFGYVHKHGPVGNMWPKQLRKKPRNRKGRFAI